MNPLLIKPAITAVVVAVASAVSFAGGYVAANWRSGSQIERLSGQNTLLSTATSKCEADIKNARAAMQALKTDAETRAQQAEEAMRQAEPEVKQRTVTITKIKEMPRVILDAQCEAIKQEQIEYVGWRHSL